MNSSSIESEIISIPSEFSNDPSLNNKSICDFKLTKKIGEGTFGTVRLGVNIQTGEEVAIKILEKVKILQLEDKTRVEREIKILKCLRHANIVQLYSVLQTDKSIYLIMEYIHGKELFDYIIENGKLNELEACKFYQQIISGIEYLQKLKIVHRDLKPDNIMIDGNGYLKLIDFGTAKFIKDYTNTIIGTPHYMAPEVLSGKGYSFSCDYWSIGVIAFEIFYHKYPFGAEATEAMEIYNDIMYSNFKFPFKNDMFEHLNHFIEAMLTKNVNKRPILCRKIS